jgi:hypothetical protein
MHLLPHLQRAIALVTCRDKKLLLTTFRTIRGTKRQTLVVRGKAIRRLKAGRYRVDVAPGTKGTQLAPATSRVFVLVR